MLALASQAPDPKVVTHLGYQGPLSTFWKGGPMILFFYPKDDTTICTRQACTLQTSFNEFAKWSANVMGSSTGSVDDHKAFATKHKLTFPLIADEGGKLAQAYDAFRSLLRFSKRVTYVIGTDGTIIGRCHDELSVPAHLEMIRQTLGK